MSVFVKKGVTELTKQFSGEGRENMNGAAIHETHAAWSIQLEDIGLTLSKSEDLAPS